MLSVTRPDPDELAVDIRSVSTEFARLVLDRGLEVAATLGKPMTFAVCDASGLLLAFLRMVGAPLATIQTSQAKAWTAVATRRPTHHWAEIMEEDPPLRWGVPAGIEGVIVFGGGYPIVEGDAIVGGLGVSGAHHEVDRKVAEDVLSALGLFVHPERES